MSNIFQHWWRSRQFRQALKSGNLHKAQFHLQQIEDSGARLNWLETLFKRYLYTEKALKEKSLDNRELRQNLQQQVNCVRDLEKQIGKVKIFPDSYFINHVRKAFRLYNHDEAKVQCTGIDERIFDDFEYQLVQFLTYDLIQLNRPDVQADLKAAFQDLDKLRLGIDPDYNLSLSAQAYLIKYFLENVYCSYLAWFFVYELGRLSPDPKILDIAAGPQTLAYGLALLLHSNSGFDTMPPLHISYYSLDKEKSLQYQGLKFWRQYIEAKPKTPNLYFRFETTDILTYAHSGKTLPPQFFDFICVSHCFFYDARQRDRVYSIYRRIFKENLASDGWILLIIQSRKLFKTYNTSPTENIEIEKAVLTQFASDLGLNINWYQYVTSTESRMPMNQGFAEYARENLPKQPHINQFKKQYFDFLYHSTHYAIDDYIILAQPQIKP
ncbi:MAG: hypothetical protein SAJ12_16790 [Jaaginema sp. PMC 1079.18]|nr:hypothetical protein [Jaaginema sp. PMC 1080.18]MEC4852641.1 hypothetical protein [Jaaginema sp. PMC 1079.18]MEC4866712.1 hypothetical protein [Jaaginema sp. PMC 1078.18]